MKKGFLLASIFCLSLSPLSNVDAKTIEWYYKWDNGCVGKQIYHSVLWGMFEWISYEVVSCPEGVSAPSHATIAEE